MSSNELNSEIVNTWLCHPLDNAERATLDRLSKLEDVVKIAAMPDVHVAADACVGTAVATKHLVYPGLVGGDIGCGMLAVAFDSSAHRFDRGAGRGKFAAEVLTMLRNTIPGSRRNRRHVLPWPDKLDPHQLSHDSLKAYTKSEAPLQLGTLGGGNHFVELQRDEADDRLWLMIHSGSRGLGQMIRNHHLSVAKSTGVTWLDTRQLEGQAYLNDVEFARAYASANRVEMANLTARAVGSDLEESTLIHLDHNHVEPQMIDDEALLVHRKGAQPARLNQMGVLPGSMGTLSYHVCGRGVAASLWSSAHGAGRQLSRTQAREKFTNADVKYQLSGVWFDPSQTKALREESPRAYKDVRAVAKAQAELADVVRTLRPVLGFKTGG
jgi:tRNA-splicing ligase RtcB (3'-phosphate/5'-hydroxy nucleic acid ligase)